MLQKSSKAAIIVFFFFSLSAKNLFAQDFLSRKAFQAAMTAFKEHNYYSSRLLLQEIIHKDHTGDYADDAQYYLALTYYYEEDYNSALFEIKIFLRDYAMSEFAPSAEYWMGECYYYLKDYRNALQSHYDFVKKYPDDKHAAYAYYTIGYIYNVLKRYDDAVAEFEKALTQYPASKMTPGIALQLGIAHYNNGDYTLARKQFQNMLITLEDSDELNSAQLWIGKTFYAEKKYVEAEKQFRFILDNFKNNDLLADASYQLALTRYKLNDFDGSLLYLNSIIKTWPDWVETGSAYFRKGQILQMKKDYSNAAENYKVVVEKYSGSEFNSQALELLADCYQQIGENKKALEIYDKILEGFAIENDAEIVILQKKGNLLFQNGDFRNSALAFEKLYEKYPTSDYASEAMYMRAQSHFKGQMYNVALDVLGKLEEKYPKSKWKTDAYFLEGEVYYALTEYTKALQSYNKIIRFFPKHARYFDSLMGVGWSYFELKQYARASDWFRKSEAAAVTNTQKSNVLLATASCMYNLRGFEDAIKYYNKTIEKFPKEEAAEEATFQIAWVYYRESAFDKSIAGFDVYLDRYPEGKRQIEAIYFKGWSFFNLKKFEEAMTEFIQVYEKSAPDNVFKEKALLDYAKTLTVVKKNQEAILSYKKFLKEFPASNFTEEGNYALLNSFLETKNILAAEKVYEDFKKEKSSSLYLPEMLRNMGNYYRRIGYIQKADKIYKTIIENTQSPEQKIDIEFQRIKMYFEQNRVGDSLKIANDLLIANAEEYAPFRLKIITEIVQLNIQISRMDDALQMLEVQKKKAASDKTLLAQLELLDARIYMAQKKYDISGEILKKLLVIKELSISARYYLALGYYENEKFNEASEFFRQVVQKTEEEYFASWSYYFLGEIQFVKQEYLTAAREYTKIIYLYSGNHELYEKALYKAALCFKKAGKTDEYTTYKEKLKESFPESKYLYEI